MRRLEEAVALSKKALERDPMSAFLRFHLGLRYYYTQQWDLAIEQFQKAIEIDPNYFVSHMMLGVMQLIKERPEEVIRSFEKAAELAGYPAMELYCKGVAYAFKGRTNEVKKIIEEMLELERKTYVSPIKMASIYRGIGDIDSTFEWLEKAVDQQDTEIITLHINPVWNTLQSDPRFQALLRKMNLQP